MQNFNLFEKIDAHIHFNADRSALLDQAEASNFQLLTINTEVPFFPDIEDQFALAIKRKEGPLSFITTFPTKNWGCEGWLEEAMDYLKKTIDHGAVGVKVWKNIGMTLQDGDDNFVMLDHPSFDPFFEYFENNDIPVLGHLGEPRNCWLPVDQMTVKGDRDYFSQHPEYHMYLHPEYPSYEEQIKARDRRMAKHPSLRFIGAHLASLEWSIEWQATWLDQFPDAGMDLAERICHLQHQAISDPDKVRSFLIEYQDRIIYGTDVIDNHSLSDEELKRHIAGLWKQHWHFFQSGDMMTNADVHAPFRGMNLPETVLHKIFRENALTYYPRLRQNVE